MTKRTQFIINNITKTNDDDTFYILTEFADYKVNDNGDLIDLEGMPVHWDNLEDHLDNWVIEDKYFFDYLSYMNAHEDYIKFLEGE